jgi:hypothetical protein
MARWPSPAHPPTGRIVCDRCGNRTIGDVVVHDRRCGCPPLVWNREPAPARWFEVEARDVPPEWGDKHPEYHQPVRADMTHIDPRTFEYWCSRCDAWRRWSEADLDRPVIRAS